MKVAILAEQNFNLIDGSTIWLLNVCKLMATLTDVQATVLLRHPLTDRILADEVPANLRLVDAAEIARMTGMPGTVLEPHNVARTLRDWEAAEGRFDRIFVRGEAFLSALIEDPGFASRLVAYAPGVSPDLSRPEPGWLVQGRALRMPVVVQSEPAKRALESLFDYPAHVVHVVPPIVFHDAAASTLPARDPKAAVLCYSGKIDLHYGLDWLIALARRMADLPGLKLSLIAGKDTWRPRHPEFFAEMDAFRADVAEGRLGHVSIVTGVAHARARTLMAKADFAWCLRHARYDDVIEISTKIVEFCTAGVVPILNDTALNRAMFGEDYPYFVDIVADDVEARVIAMLRSKGSPEHALALERIATVAASFSSSRLAGALDRAIRGNAAGATDSPAGDGPAGVAAAPLSSEPRHVLLATHDAKFLRQFLDRVQGDRKIRISRQNWASTTKPAGPPVIPGDVDTVFCEWACGNAIWHSRNKRPGTRLIVRLHRFEAFRDFPRQIDWQAVDALIVVSDHFRDLMVQDFGVDATRIHVMPQYIDWHELRRPKLPAARFTLGMVGINPFDHKRFDRAIDVFAALRARDPRFRLAVRSVMPWQIDWVWNNNPEDRARFVEVFSRIARDPLLRGAVRFDPAGPDMEEWYRGIGTILSSSESEGCHTAVMEGMASGAFPVVYDWPGARSLFAPYVHADMRAALDDVIAFAETDSVAARETLSQSMRRHDVEVFTRRFFHL